jgi:hypothetical protein
MPIPALILLPLASQSARPLMSSARRAGAPRPSVTPSNTPYVAPCDFLTAGLERTVEGGRPMRAREGDQADGDADSLEATGPLPLAHFLESLPMPALGGERSLLCAPLMFDRALVRGTQVSSYPLLPTPTHSYPLLPTPTHSYPLLPTPTHSYPLLPTQVMDDDEGGEEAAEEAERDEAAEAEDAAQVGFVFCLFFWIDG